MNKDITKTNNITTTTIEQDRRGLNSGFHGAGASREASASKNAAISALFYFADRIAATVRKDMRATRSLGRMISTKLLYRKGVRNLIFLFLSGVGKAKSYQSIAPKGIYSVTYKKCYNNLLPCFKHILFSFPSIIPQNPGLSRGWACGFPQSGRLALGIRGPL